jgi:hypothetical protein
VVHSEDETLALLLISTWELYTGRTLRNAPAVELTEQELIDFWDDDAAAAPPPSASPAGDDGDVSIQALLTLTLSALIAAITCGLTLATGATSPAALLSAGGAGGGVLGLIPRLIDLTRVNARGFSWPSGRSGSVGRDRR